MLEEINYQDILIMGISAGMTMGIITSVLSSFLGIFQNLVEDCAT